MCVYITYWVSVFYKCIINYRVRASLRAPYSPRATTRACAMVRASRTFRIFSLPLSASIKYKGKYLYSIVKTRGALCRTAVDASCIRPSRARREWLFLRPVTDRSLTASACSHGAAVLAISSVIGMHCGGESCPSCNSRDL